MFAENEYKMWQSHGGEKRVITTSGLSTYLRLSRSLKRASLKNKGSFSRAEAARERVCSNTEVHEFYISSLSLPSLFPFLLLLALVAQRRRTEPRGPSYRGQGIEGGERIATGERDGGGQTCLN